jgi:hypothetical protein
VCSLYKDVYRDLFQELTGGKTIPSLIDGGTKRYD